MKTMTFKEYIQYLLERETNKTEQEMYKKLLKEYK